MGSFLANLSPQQRIIGLLGGGILLLVVVIGLALALRGGGKNNNQANNQPSGYVTVFRHLEQKEQDEAAAALGQAHITQFQIGDDGTLMVEKDKEAEARIALGEAQVPKNPAEQGLDIFNKSNFISTDFDKRIEYIRGLSGELTRWVRKVDGVEDAAVLVNLPQDSLFQSEKKPITASVMVKVQPQRQLSSTQVDGIQHMIASAVPGLMVDNVTVVDNNGSLLSSGMEENSGNQGDRALSRDIDQQNRITDTMEIDLQNRLQLMLDKLLGPGKALVQVALELDFSHRAVRDELMQPVLAPNGAPLPADRVINNEQSGNSGQAGGPAGTYANVPSYPALPAGASSTASLSSTVRRFENDRAAFSKQEDVVENASGQIKRMSIAVLLPDSVAPDQVNRLKNVIATAAGADPARRDQVTVELVKFDNSLVKQLQDQLNAAKTGKLKIKGPALGWKWVWIIGGLVLLLALIVSLIARRRRPAENPFEALTSSLESDALPGGFDQGSAFGPFAPGQIPIMGYPSGTHGVDPYGGQQYGEQPLGARPFGQGQEFAAPPGGAQGDGPFNFLYEVAPEQVAEILAQERPATAAGVLSLLDGNFGATVVAQMPPELQQEVFTRLSQGAALPAMTQRMVSQTIRRKLGVPV